MSADAMTPQRFAELRAQFHALMVLDASERARHLEALGATDVALREALERLLGNVHPPDLEPSPDGTAQRIGAFRTLRRIGRGGMGEVYLAERVDGGFEQRVALKVVRRGALPGELSRRFAHERRLLARLEHPNIARLIDGGTTSDGWPWLAMELVDGRTIARYADECGLDVASRVALVRRVCGAVAFAHGHLVVHRDIKPANILVGADGEPKLLDFGIGKLLDDEADPTLTGLRALTARYAAPEQVAGGRTTTATDVYALGVLLFELVARCSPYAHAQAGSGDWVQSVVGEAPMRLSDAVVDGVERRRVRGDLDRIVAKALAKTPVERYAGAAALADDLDDWLAGRALRSGIGGTAALTRAVLRRYRWPLALAAVVMLSLGIGAAVALVQARKAAEQARIAQANLDAMLGVLSAANPRRFAGHEPNASEFLKTAAEHLEREYAQQPALIGNALGEIGHGLLNLGHARDAEPVLAAAVAAIESDPAASSSRRLGTYKLLVFAQDHPDAVSRALASARRIAVLAAAPDADASAALDALGSAGGVLSKHGMTDDAARLFSTGHALVANAASRLSVSARESYWRQVAWAALRAHDPATARDALRRSLDAIAQAPDGFMALRVAEAHLLVAEAAIALGDARAAHDALDRAAPPLRAEYASDHPQRAALDVLVARLQLLDGDAAGAETLATDALRRLGDGSDARRDRLHAHVVVARAGAARGACDAASAALARARADRDALQPPLPRERAAFDAAAADVGAACAPRG